MYHQLHVLTSTKGELTQAMLRDPGQIIKSYLQLASIAVKTLEYSTTEVTSTWLLPEMVLRVANMLNYFLQFLTGLLH